MEAVTGKFQKLFWNLKKIIPIIGTFPIWFPSTFTHANISMKWKGSWIIVCHLFTSLHSTTHQLLFSTKSYLQQHLSMALNNGLQLQWSWNVQPSQFMNIPVASEKWQSSHDCNTFLAIAVYYVFNYCQ